MLRYQCVLCDHIFELATELPVLPTHRYPRGLYRGRPCMSRYGVPFHVSAPPVAITLA